MAYTPELSMNGSATLRRMAWAGKVTMTKAIDEAIQILSRQMDRQAVCAACRDRKCEFCYFSNLERR